VQNAKATTIKSDRLIVLSFQTDRFRSRCRAVEFSMPEKKNKEQLSGKTENREKRPANSSAERW
jgi:hypothetical protein